MIRRLKKDVLEQLPAKRRMRVPLDPDKMDQGALQDVENQVRRLGPAASSLFSGSSSGSGGTRDVSIAEIFRRTAEAKLNAVLDYMEHLLQLGTKFLLFGHHHSTLDAVERKLKEQHVIAFVKTLI